MDSLQELILGLCQGLEVNIITSAGLEDDRPFQIQSQLDHGCYPDTRNRMA